MKAAEREIVRQAELAAMGPRDAVALLVEVSFAIRNLVNEGDLHAADRVLAGMTSSTARVVSLALAGDLDRRMQDEPDELADLLARMEDDCAAMLAREDERLDLARVEAEKIAAAGNRGFIDRSFIRRMHDARRNGGGGSC